MEYVRPFFPDHLFTLKGTPAPTHSGASTNVLPERVREETAPSDSEGGASTDAPTGAQYGHWLLLTFIPASLTLGLTTYVTSELSPIPLFWIAPLFVYLLSFVIAFFGINRRVLTVIKICASVAAFLAINNIWVQHFSQTGGTMVTVNVGVSMHLLALGLISLACHGQVAIGRPGFKHLTSYFFAISLGGVLGSLFNAILAPALFKAFIEYPLILVLSLGILVPLPLSVRIKSVRFNTLALRVIASLLIALAVGQVLTGYKNVYYRSRNFSVPFSFESTR